MDNFVLLGAGTWLVLQILALVLMRGAWRRTAWVSAAMMGLAAIVAALGALAGSNLAPIWVVFALPVCLAWIVMLWIILGITRLITR
ncbi:hypothetical protein [Pelagibacterium lacus]|uniref:Uncharacterized protein n=1 Tax=Pelagibacterium lacus TaxID=2282655 RepID=A0A369W690_9HYPH|nr:hypothetical protein [Pelagibacterium lacus]RDE07601.1 hypothetical protein DVH29_15870 [Pelagibacterium lacus]